jgi:hypothetical protein
MPGTFLKICISQSQDYETFFIYYKPGSERSISGYWPLLAICNLYCDLQAYYGTKARTDITN